MDDQLTSTKDVTSWTARIAAATVRHEARGLAALVKPAALVAAVAGRLDLIEAWLAHLPAELIERDPQLLYWSGTVILMKRPIDAQPRLERALERFVARSETTWMLLAWSGIVDCIFFLYRDLRELDPWIDWMTPERETAVDKLPQTPRSLVVSSMLFALAFRQPNHPRMEVWRDRAERLIERDPICDLGARLSAGLITDYTWRGNLAAAEIVRTRFRAHASRKHLSPLAAVLGHLNDATLFLHEGKLEQCRNAVASGLEVSARNNVRNWEGILRCHAIVTACSLEEGAQAHGHIAAIEQLFAEQIPVDEAYYRGMLCWNAFVSGDHIGAVSRCAGALETADGKGVPYIQAACRIGVALVLFEAGHHKRGELLLEEGLRIGREIGNPLIAWIGGLFLSHMAYARGDHAAGDGTLERAMRVGRDHALAHFFFWPRAIMTGLIDRALERGYSSDYARHIIAVHALTPGKLPARSDQWAFNVRIYTFGEPRIEYPDGRIEPLSAQFLRQIALLAALISKEGRPAPLHILAADVYPQEDVEVIGSLKRVLHSLRERIGQCIIQRNAALALDFRKVWIDACSLQRLLREADTMLEIEAWLNQYYRGHFMDRIEHSEIVLGIRRRICGQVESVLRDAYVVRERNGAQDALRQFEGRWQDMFPALFAEDTS